ncbi:ABC transporter permease [Mesorhizobium sp. BAC0120]|uniref:ABC transporter permease n=1 Tax=Mesorhizobium sp. BAC0120 TaxID=3090670 RepID=UPI00298C4B19|nr:ABC transporter permease [Mesorhizobium sp. BAC0120]MDW6023408.1 ABC transporter permease [Mesorhizobium sp. BAC0120]
MPLIATVAGLLITSLLLLSIEVNPLNVYAALLRGALGSLFGVSSTLRWATPLILAGLAVSIGFKAGLFNAGLSGQIYVGGFVGSLIGFSITLPWGLHPVAAILGGGVAGALWAFIPAILRRYLGASEIVTSLMLWYVAIGVADFLVRQFFRDPTSAAFLMSVKVMPSAVLPSIFPVGNVSVMLFASIGASLLLSYLSARSRLGYEVRMTGANPRFAHYSGVPTGQRLVLAFCISGFLGGLIGASESIGINQRFVSQFDPGFGFDGFLVALLANGSLAGCIPAGLFLGVLKAGGAEVERALGLSKSIIWILQGSIILFVSAHRLRFLLSRLASQLRRARWKSSPSR